MKTHDLSEMEGVATEKVKNPNYQQFSWWINPQKQRIFILIGFWENDITTDCPGWRVQLAEVGKEKPVIISLTEFEDQIKKGNFKQFYK
jgi:hypothetical protein